MAEPREDGWAGATAAIVEGGGTVLVVGDTDTGKTTFCRRLLNAALAAGRRVALVDADIGQSEVGPPACVGLALPRAPVEAASDLEAVALAFVGSNGPRGRMLEHSVATWSMASEAAAAGAELIVVDTTGYVRGPSAVRLKRAKLELLRPSHAVFLERREECAPIRRVAEAAGTVRVHRLPVAPEVARKSPSYRTQRRAARFARYFQEAEPRTYEMERVAMLETWLGQGAPVAPHLLKYMSDSLGTRVYYAEMQERHLGMVVATPPQRGVDAVHEQLRPESITVTPVSLLRHLLLGLTDGARLLGLGTLEAVDFRRRAITVVTPLRGWGAVRLIQFGILRVRPDGAEVGSIRPGDV